MQRALLTNDFSMSYVAENSAIATPTLFKIATMWASLEGSVILWSLVLSGYLLLMHLKFQSMRRDALVGWAQLTGFVVSTFFFALMVGPADPFREVVGAIPLDGPGPNPLLQNHLLMAFHPPLLYIGYVGFTVPFCFAIAALVTGRLGEGWLLATRRWTLIAWGALTAGIVLGAWWSYEVLGWGGYWGWDPVENASLLPWLTGTAFIHSVLIQERRGMLRVWNLSLVCATFALTILGTFLTRSGVLDSVHAFSSGDVGGWLLAFFGAIVVTSVALIAWRGDTLRSPGSIDSPISREGAFLFNNLLFAGFAAVVLLGTVFPLLVEVANDDLLSVGRPYFDRMAAPAAFVMLFLMAVAPALPWRKASGELLATRLRWPAWAGGLVIVGAVALGMRDAGALIAIGLGTFAGTAALRQLALATRRHGLPGLLGRANGGMVVHLGVVLISVAVAVSSNFATRTEVQLAPGETASVAGHTFTLINVEEINEPNVNQVRANVQIDNGPVYAPAIQRFPGAAQAVGVPSVRSRPTHDVYLTLITLPSDENPAATIGIIVNPMVMWIWIGGALMVIGTGMAIWPGKRRKPTAPSGQLIDISLNSASATQQPNERDPAQQVAP
jgi:cytochrome c-type biogenesis protein CcmF